MPSATFWDTGKQSDQCLYCLHTGISIENKIKMKKYTSHPLNEKWTHPINKDGMVHKAKKLLCESYISRSCFPDLVTMPPGYVL